ncbi:FKBP-type peptidyl-prolyl cis-trans isomerase [Pseudopedobacter beijingensis]|uniref:Peptidyl-prolyl cis-trans isomerase n=1 Tax=Pseudopedobacter beijingensis TaxID=1207056 RepID=A0ABW4I996_9SPHI
MVGSCKKVEDDTLRQYNSQLSSDDITIRNFLSIQEIPAIRTESGVYYQILQEGEGEILEKWKNPKITVIYTGRFLDGRVFADSKEKEEMLGKEILGWQIGLKYINKGGKIRLIIPSGLAYGSDGGGIVPSNTILDYDIELVNIK